MTSAEPNHFVRSDWTSGDEFTAACAACTLWLVPATGDWEARRMVSPWLTRTMATWGKTLMIVLMTNA